MGSDEATWFPTPTGHQPHCPCCSLDRMDEERGEDPNLDLEDTFDHYTFPR